MNDTILDNWGRTYLLPGVYSDFQNFCRLVHVAPEGTKTPVELDDEPVGWSKLKFTLKRGELHGVNAEYTSSGTALEFDGSSGRDFVESIFLAEGEDANILFQYGLRIPEIVDPGSGIGIPGYDIVEYEGRVNLGVRKTNQRRISASLERNTLQTLVEARKESNVSLSASRTLDGAQITPPDFKTITLSPQSLDERFTCNQTGSPRVEQSFQGDTNGHIWIQFDTSQPQIDEIDEHAGGRPMGVSESDGPIVNDEWEFKLRSSGTRKISIEIAYNFWVTVKKRTVSIGAAKITGFKLDTILTHIKADGTRTDYPITTPWREGLGHIPPNGMSEEIVEVLAKGTLDVSIDTQAGDKLFLYGLCWFSHNKNELQQTQVVVTSKTFRMSITGKSTNAASSARCLPIGEALNAALTLITGKPDRFRSAFYGLQSARYPVDGCGARRVIFNGFAARNFKPLERPIATSFGDLVASISAIDATGLEYGYEIDTVTNEPIEIATMKPISEFYRPVELLRLDEVADYSEETITAELYSTLDVGYQEWVDDGSNSLEEVFTTHQITTPIKSQSAKKVISSKFIASSLAIEQTRREQFATTPKDGTSFDEKVFIVQCKPITSFSGAATFTRGFIGNIVQVAEPISWLGAGMRIAIGGSGLNSGNYTVSFVSDLNKRPWSFYVNEAILTEDAASITIQPTDTALDMEPETGADFDSVTGLQSPDTTYNLRITPARMLWANAPIWAGCLINKDKWNLINKKAVTETGLIAVGFRNDAFFKTVTTNLYVDWLAAGMTVTISGNTSNTGDFTVLAVAPPDYTPWGFLVKENLNNDYGSLVNIAFKTIGTDDLYAAVNKTKIPNNKSVMTALDPSDPCGRQGLVSESAPISVDQLIELLLFLPRLIKFKVRLSHDQIQRLRLGHMGLLPVELDPFSSDIINPNYGYISLLNESGVRVAGYLNSVEYTRSDEDAVFELRQTALDLNDTFSGLDCGQFAGITLAQAQAMDERFRRRLELCRFIDVDPL